MVTHNNEAWHYYSQINYEASKFYSIAFAESLQEQVLAAAASAAGAGPAKSASEEPKGETSEPGKAAAPPAARKQKILIPEDYGEKIVKMTMNQSSQLSGEQRGLGQKYIRHIVEAI